MNELNEKERPDCERETSRSQLGKTQAGDCRHTYETIRSHILCTLPAADPATQADSVRAQRAHAVGLRPPQAPRGLSTRTRAHTRNLEGAGSYPVRRDRTRTDERETRARARKRSSHEQKNEQKRTATTRSSGASVHTRASGERRRPSEKENETESGARQGETKPGTGSDRTRRRHEREARERTRSSGQRKLPVN